MTVEACSARLRALRGALDESLRFGRVWLLPYRPGQRLEFQVEPC